MDGSRLYGWLVDLRERAACIAPAHYCQAIFVFLAIGVLTVNSLPANAKRYLLDYGAREIKDVGVPHDRISFQRISGAGIVEDAVATFASYSQVPHAWFSSFYIAYLVCACGWSAQWLLWRLRASSGGLFIRLVEQQIASGQLKPPAASMSLIQVYTAMGLEALQAMRRIYEHVSVFKASGSKMNFTHWALGLAFYVCMSVAVWIEGSQAIFTAENQSFSLRASAAHHAVEWAKLGVGMFLFLFAWLQQYRCHGHLASLKKYSLPEEGMFRYLVCPHYTCECILYLGLSILAAPAGQLFNRTLLPSLFFVLACLGVTANRTKTWYIEKFGAVRVAKKWSMIPFIF